MKYFYAVVHKDEGSAFGVHFPDLPGCFSAADDLRWRRSMPPLPLANSPAAPFSPKRRGTR
jgi:hypothetical protein